MLANKDFKITYIMDRFVRFGKDSNLFVNIILDYEDDRECHISRDDLEMLKMEMVKQITVWYLGM